LGTITNLKAWRGLALGLVLSLADGCSSGKPEEVRKPVHPVRGKVLFQGKPAKGAFVFFVPVNEPPDTPDPRPRAEVGDDGSFTLSMYGIDDGAPVGEYKVAVTWEGKVLPDGREEPLDKLMGRYSVASTRLKATVKEGPNELPPFQLQ
jgi:hypothetical protein